MGGSLRDSDYDDNDDDDGDNDDDDDDDNDDDADEDDFLWHLRQTPRQTHILLRNVWQARGQTEMCGRRGGRHTICLEL